MRLAKMVFMLAIIEIILTGNSCKEDIRIKITAQLHQGNLLGEPKHEPTDREYFISQDTEKLSIITGPPISIHNIRGLEKLQKVKRIYLSGINDYSHEVIGQISVFKDTIEAIVFDCCNLESLDFLQDYKKLKAIVFISNKIRRNAYFDFEKNPELEYFYFFGQLPEQETHGYIDLKINPSKSMKYICINPNYEPLHISEEQFQKWAFVKKVFIGEEAFTSGGNEVTLLEKYKNVSLFKDDEDDLDIEAKQKYKTLVGNFDDWEKEAIGL